MQYSEQWRRAAEPASINTSIILVSYANVSISDTQTTASPSWGCKEWQHTRWHANLGPMVAAWRQSLLKYGQPWPNTGRPTLDQGWLHAGNNYMAIALNTFK